MSRKLTVREKVYGYVKRKYGSEPEYLWRRFPDYAIFRHEDNRKWYGLIMDISAENLGLPGEGRVDILNVKLDDLMLADMLVQREGRNQLETGRRNPDRRYRIYVCSSSRLRDLV